MVQDAYKAAKRLRIVTQLKGMKGAAAPYLLAKSLRKFNSNGKRLNVFWTLSVSKV